MKLEITEEMLDQMIAGMEEMKPLIVGGTSRQIGEYKGYKVRVELQKPEVKK